MKGKGMVEIEEDAWDDPEDKESRFDSSVFDLPVSRASSAGCSGYLLVRVVRSKPHLPKFLKERISTQKLNKNNTKWIKRYFVLDGDGIVSYFDNQNSNRDEVRGTLYLQQRTKILQSEYRSFCFEIRTPSQKKIVLAAESEEERQRWIKALQTGCKNSPPRPLKVCVVGDDVESNKAFIRSFFLECGQDKLAERIQTTENLEFNLEVTGEKVRLVLCCVSSTDFPSLRVLNYVGANAFMMCYNALDYSSFENLEKVWYPEVKAAKNAPSSSLFVISLKDQESRLEVDKEIGEEFSEFLGAVGFFDVNINEDIEVQSVNSLGATAAEAFLNVLEATLEGVDAEDADSEVENEEDESDTTDVANMKDFEIAAQAQGNFRQFITMQTNKLSKFVTANAKKLKSIASQANIKSLHKSYNLSNVSTGTKQSLMERDTASLSKSNTGSQNSANKKPKFKNSKSKEKIDEETLGTLVKLRAALKNLRPKKKQNEKQKIDTVMKDKAHFVDRTETGSLVFLGEDFLVEHE